LQAPSALKKLILWGNFEDNIKTVLFDCTGQVPQQLTAATLDTSLLVF
jgi:hypothetical protein